VRLFVALELDEDAQALLAEYQRRLAGLDRAVRWVRPEQIHLTLKFLGDVPDGQVMQVCRALDGLAAHEAFEFQIDGIGTFGPPRSPRVVWVGVRMPNSSLAEVQEACEKGLAELGFPSEGRAFKPHLTLGRVKDPRAGREVSEAVSNVQAQASGPLVQRAGQVILFESILRPEGPQYIVTHNVMLRKE
jgi:RNA 2',3'-cyclic 3'-phosphodiesterase